MKCQCGAPLKETPKTSYSQAEFWLLDVVRRKVLGLNLANDGGSNMPRELITRMPLWELLSLVRLLGTQSLIAKKSAHRPIGRELLHAAANVVDEWPTNFNRLLRHINPYGTNTHKSPPPTELNDVLALVASSHAERRKRVLRSAIEQQNRRPTHTVAEAAVALRSAGGETKPAASPNERAREVEGE
jgi:hypothetical protein